jgi:hypothetical protein
VSEPPARKVEMSFKRHPPRSCFSKFIAAVLEERQFVEHRDVERLRIVQPIIAVEKAEVIRIDHGVGGVVRPGVSRGDIERIVSPDA